MKRLFFTFCLTTAAMLSRSNCSMSQEFSVVYPNEFADQEGTDGDDGTTAWQNGTHVQGVFLASEFASLPETHRQIVGYRFRPDGVLINSPRTVTWDLSLRLSTTQLQSLDDMSSVFEENTGLPDETLVLDGLVTISTQNVGPVGGPKEFDFEVLFENPFYYDPAQGNLLWDSIGFGPTQAAGQDSHRGEKPYGFGLFAANSAAESADQRLSYNPLIFEFIFAPAFELCDVNRDRSCNAADIDTMTQNVLAGKNTWDERTALIHHAPPNGFGTYFGDANLDGEFNSSDFTHVFLAGEYEDAIDDNSGWAEGDWDGDGDFTSGDFVTAFLDGGYEQGPRPAAAVPEPAAALLGAISALALVPFRRFLTKRT